MKEFNYTCPTNIGGISNEKIRAYFSMLYCEIRYPAQKGGCQRAGLLSETHPIIGAANLLPFGSVGEELEKRWREISKETTDIIDRAKNAPIQDRPIIMDNLISALALFKKMQKNMIDAPDEAVATCYPNGKEIPFNVSGEPKGLKRVKALANEVMGAWKVFLAWAENTHYCFGGETTNNTPPKPAKKSGRPPKEPEGLKNRMIDDADGSKLKKIHTIMAGKKNRDAVLIIRVCVDRGLMRRPTSTEAIKEFGKIFCISEYNRYMSEKYEFSPIERAGIIKNLK